MIKKIYKLILKNINFSNPLDKIINNNLKIAVVGNSEIIKNNKFGDLIDSHDFIIRFNRAPTSNFEEYVGSRTDLRVCGEGVFTNTEYKVKGLEFLGEEANFIKKLKNSKILLLHNNKQTFFNNCMDWLMPGGYLIIHLVDREKFDPILPPGNPLYTSDKNEIFYFNLTDENILKFKIASSFNLIKKISYLKKEKQFTSGMIIICLLLLKKIDFSLFGFSTNKTDKLYTSYWQNGGFIENPVHNLNFENKLMNTFIKKKKIRYFI